MGALIYSMIVSQDGYVADSDGDFSWAQPTEDALASINAQLSNVSTYLYGRRMYELMAVWETDPAVAAQSPESTRCAKVWQQAGKIVYSKTLDATHTSRTQLVRQFNPAEITRLKRPTDRDLTVDGPTLAAEAFRYRLVDHVALLVCPLTLGSSLAFWPKMRVDLRLGRVERFARGVVQLNYDVLHTDH